MLAETATTDSKTTATATAMALVAAMMVVGAVVAVGAGVAVGNCVFGIAVVDDDCWLSRQRQF